MKSTSRSRYSNDRRNYYRAKKLTESELTGFLNDVVQFGDSLDASVFNNSVISNMVGNAEGALVGVESAKTYRRVIKGYAQKDALVIPQKILSGIGSAIVWLFRLLAISDAKGKLAGFLSEVESICGDIDETLHVYETSNSEEEKESEYDFLVDTFKHEIPSYLNDMKKILSFYSPSLGDYRLVVEESMLKYEQMAIQMEREYKSGIKRTSAEIKSGIYTELKTVLRHVEYLLKSIRFAESRADLKKKAEKIQKDLATEPILLPGQ